MSETWGGQITKKALIALVVFLVLVTIYITIRYERYMAISALVTMVFDLIVTAGVYSLVGFEVTPATVIGLLTILGFSLYDTVIVFDKVEENTHGFEHTTRRTFAEQANLAINQTFMRSINTSLISVLPIMSLIVVAVWLLGVGTLKDLALVQLVGVIVGTYSSIFFATPLLVTLRERTELVRTHTRRVLNRRKPTRATEVGEDADPAEARRRRALAATPAPDKPAPGARPRGRQPAGPDDRRVSETPGGGRADGPPEPGRHRGGRAVADRRAGIDGVLGGPGRDHRLRRRRPCDHLQHQHRGRRGVGGPQAFARVLTGFDYHGPDGQVVADHDFGSISVVGRAPLVLDYEISADAVYSDGKPITCDDMVLAWASQSGRLPGFDAASRAGYSDIASVDCAPGQKKARVTFAQDRAFVDFGQLFTATSMMPSHVISDELGVDVTTALLNNDGPAVDRIAQVWNTTWDLSSRDFDPKRFPSSGPYKIDSVRKDGSVVLVANDKWWGAKPITNRITVWPRGADIQDRIKTARLRCGGYLGWFVGNVEPARRLRTHRQRRRRASSSSSSRRRARWRPARRVGRLRCAHLAT